MKPTITPLFTRMFPIGTAGYNARLAASFLAGSAFLGSSAMAVENFWVGGTDWNSPANWSLGRVPAQPNGAGGDNFDDAIINTLDAGFPNLTVSPVATPRDIRVGSAGGATGRVDQSAGTVSTGAGNWMFVGVAGGTGTYNLANTAGTGGVFTGFAPGTGSLNAGGPNPTAGRLYVGGDDGGADAGNGTLNMNTSGTVKVGGDFAVGGQGGTGVFNMDGGTMTVAGLTRIGDGAGSTGTFRMSAGSHSTGSEFWVGNGSIGSGTFLMNAGTLSVNNWLAVAREGGNGTFTMTGGSVIKTGAGSITSGTGTGGMALFNISGGTIDVQSGLFFLAEAGTDSTATLNLSGTGVLRAPVLYIGRNGVNTTGILNLSGTAEIVAPSVQLAVEGSSIGTANLDGGTLRTGSIDGGGSSAAATVNFNGTQIIATSVEPSFISDLDVANLAAGGLKVDTNGFDVTSAQFLAGSGGVVKSGAGKLTLSGPNEFTGGTTVNGGTLAVTTDSITAGSLTLGAGGSYQIIQTVPDAPKSHSTANFAASSLNFDLGNFGGNTSIAPLGISGAMVLSGAVTVNIADQLPATGTFPLISYGSRSGPGSFVLGTLPNGVAATISDNNAGLVSLTISSVALPTWDATISNTWDTTTANWIDQVSNSPSVFVNGNPALFTDAADGPGAAPYDVVLNSIVLPGGVTFNNETRNYTLSGTGSIGGTAGLTKQGTATTTIGTANTYTGKTLLQGGTLSVSSLANGGTASNLGAASSSPANLIFGGGTLEYTGATATIDRGFTVGNGNNTVNSNLTLASNLTVSGQVAANLGKLTKLGAGTLTLTHPGANTLANGTEGAFRIDEGSVVLSGANTQTNTVTGEIWVGSTSNAGASLELVNTSLTTNTWIAIARGNGTSDLVSSLTATGSTLSSGNISLGFAGGLNPYAATGNLTLNNSTFTTGIFNLGESSGATGNATLNGTSSLTSGDLNIGLLEGSSTGTLTLNDNSVYTTGNRVLLGVGNGTTGNLVVGGTSTFNRPNGYLSVGVSGNGNLTVKDSGKFLNPAGMDFNITDLENSKGTFTLQNSATVTGGVTYFGKGINTEATVNLQGGTYTGREAYMAQSTGSIANINLSGGTLNLGNNNEIFIGESGTATFFQTAGTFNATGWTVIGRRPGSIAEVTVSGGTFSHVMPGRNIIVGEEGTGTLTIAGAGAVVSDGNNGLVVSNSDTGIGTVNLNGGSLTVKSVHEGGGNGTSTVNFNGGLLKAADGASLEFLFGVDTANVMSGGLNIDSNGQTIAVSKMLADGGGGGGVTKLGTGYVLLNGLNEYTGTTTVTAGSLGGSGSIAGPLTVSAGGTVAPGADAVGIFTAGPTTIAGTFAAEIDATGSDTLVVGGALTISPGSTLAVTTLADGGTEPFYIIARYEGATPAPFTNVTGLSGYTVNYAYNNGTSSTNIALVSTGVNAYDAWINGFFPGETQQSIIGPDADPDKDGQNNSLEFALGGSPKSATDNAKIHALALDSDSDDDATPEFLLTIAVRGGTPVFSGSPSPSATREGFTTTVEGSTDLNGFPVQVLPVSTVTTGLPPAPAGYIYRTFSLVDSNGLPARGFMRVRVTQ